MAAPTPNPIDLTTYTAVKSWVQIATGNTSDDQIIQDAVTAFSADVLRMTGRGPIDGTIPTTSPFVTPVTYDDFYDGSGSMRQPVRNWPVVSVSLVNISGEVIPESTSIRVWGWVIDADRRFISLRGGYAPGVATFQNYRYQGGRYGYGAGVQGPGFAAGIQNVEIVSSAGFASVPYDLEMVARKTVSLNYKRRSWIGQKTQAMAQGAGTVVYNEWAMDRADANTIDYYRRRVA
jgi:hypothetical protein